MTNSSISAPVPAGRPSGRRKLLGIRIRYWRIGLICGLIYGVLLISINLIKYSANSSRLLGLAVAAALFGAVMAALFAYFERKALARLNVDEETAYDDNIFQPIQSRMVELDLPREEAMALAEEALTEYGAMIRKRDDAAGTIEAITSQNWRSYGEVLTLTVGDAATSRVTIRAVPRLYVFRLMTNYGRSWEHVQALAAHMTGGQFPEGPSRRGAGAIQPGEACSEPPSVMEAGAWQRLLALAVLYSLVLTGATSPGKTGLIIAAFTLGLLAETTAFLYFFRQVRGKRRSERQEVVESMLNNLWPAVYAPVLLANPALGWTDGGNVAAVAVAIIFVTIAFNQVREKRREREQRMAIHADREKAELQRQLAEAKLVALSAQIEPHFLFNTLASIQYLIRNDANKAAEMTGDLIRYLRLALPRMKQSTARLADELDLVRAYLGIMQIRMGSRLQFAVDEPGALADTPIPTMALITLVENAIKHGLEQKPGGGSIHVSVTGGEVGLALEVADTGGGFSTAASGTGIGLANIRERLTTLYGTRASLSLEMNQPSGVKAILTLPKEKK
ncbi:MAG: histidine kinase [Betaproteobacteria bacterium]|nr:histidine kinase [Betaproteobacteria bacterium]